MVLKDSFFTILSREEQAEMICFRIALNAQHEIYRAHFPNNPITPGVCLQQITEELTEEVLQQPLQLIHIGKARFLQVINPMEHPEVNFGLKIEAEAEGTFRITARIFEGETAFAQLTLTLQPAKNE